jgi:class 3 adenylate cyclase
MTCPSCAAALSREARFCPGCGAGVAERSCASCGQPLGAQHRFCASCGAAVPDGPAAAPRTADPAPQSERRVSSVLFADLVGFTPLAESRDPEEVRELLSGYFDRCRDVVARYGGTVEKFIGDSAVAVWGVPVAHEDDAERAVRAGLDLVEAVTDFGERTVGAVLAMRVGVVTGEVAVTLGADREGMVAGDAVNTAARVQAKAAPGAVWVDEQTRALTAAAIGYEPVGAHELKGKSEAVTLFRATAVMGVGGGVGRDFGVEAPLVGRRRELTLVKEVFRPPLAGAQRAARVVARGAGRGHVVLRAGPGARDGGPRPGAAGGLGGPGGAGRRPHRPRARAGLVGAGRRRAGDARQRRHDPGRRAAAAGPPGRGAQGPGALPRRHRRPPGRGGVHPAADLLAGVRRGGGRRRRPAARGGCAARG